MAVRLLVAERERHAVEVGSLAYGARTRSGEDDEGDLSQWDEPGVPQRWAALCLAAPARRAAPLAIVKLTRGEKATPCMQARRAQDA